MQPKMILANAGRVYMQYTATVCPHHAAELLERYRGLMARYRAMMSEA